MENKLQLLHYDAFTLVPGKGNPAGIVLDADAMTTEQMQEIAKKVGFNECCFVCSSTVANMRYRYFTPGHETPLCGHATIATTAAWLKQNHVLEDKELLIETLAGNMKINYCYRNHEIMMEQADAQFVEFTGDKGKLMQSIGLTYDDYDERYPICYGSTGSWTVIVPIKQLASFEKMVPHNKDFPTILKHNPKASIHPFTMECYDGKNDLHGRHFSSMYSGTIEDSVTGTASGVMSAYYLKYIDTEKQEVDLYIEQGNEISKEGVVHAFARNEGNHIKVRISGKAAENECITVE